MVTETKPELKRLYESIFWDEDDPRRELTKKGVPITYAPGHDEVQSIDMSQDSFIWAFCGPRGAGKSLSMTYYAGKAVYLYNVRLISNYPIDFIIIRADGTKTEHHSEPLDVYKLLCFDKEYQNCLIIIDEAPDIISHMAAMTWKNRLLNVFVRQLRKNRNSLFLGAQNFYLIDKSMRWQVDIIVDCKDAFRQYGGANGLVRGACILLDFRDNSGLWTGRADENEIIESFELPGAVIWGAYDTYYQQDIWESLKKVDITLTSYEVGKNELDDSDYLERAAAFIDTIKTEGSTIAQREFYDALNLTPKEKRDISLRLKTSGIVMARESTGNRSILMDFSQFSIPVFMKGKE